MLLKVKTVSPAEPWPRLLLYNNTVFNLWLSWSKTIPVLPIVIKPNKVLHCSKLSHKDTTNSFVINSTPYFRIKYFYASLQVMKFLHHFQNVYLVEKYFSPINEKILHFITIIQHSKHKKMEICNFSEVTR